MYKIFLTLIFSALLNAEMVGGVAVVVKGEPITLYEIEQEMQASNVGAAIATDILIRKKLEEAEITERKISIDSAEVYDDIKKIAAANKMSVSDFYEAVRGSNGLSSTEFKEKTKEKLLSQKLYAAIAYSSIDAPSEDETKEYYELHKDSFAHPKAFSVIIYTSNDKEILQKKISSPMFYSQNITKSEQRLAYERISVELAGLLEKQKLNSFSPIVPDGKGSFMSFYLKDVESAEEITYENLKNQIENLIMGAKREQVLSDYFARLRNNADIKIVREAK
jgi:hypothetical protein